jgi:dihydroflavonol-4-reductase
MIVVTGATGHIGNVLIRGLLAKGNTVKVIIPPTEDTKPLDGLKVDIVRGNVCEIDSLKPIFNKDDIVFHLAGMISIVPGKKKLLHQVNVLGTRNVVEACMSKGVKRLVYTSSIHAVREPPHGTIIDETSPYDPVSVLGDYAKSKALGTLEVMKGMKQGLDAVIVCPTGVIGPFDYRVSDMGQLIINYMKKDLKAYLGGSYDYADVRDVANGLILALEKGRSGESYILSGQQITLRDYLLTIEDITGIKAPSYRIPTWLARTVGTLAIPYYWITKRRPIFTVYSADVLASNSLVSSDKARHELGYTTRSINESISDAIDWFKENGLI